MRILITGACGFVGSAVAESLLERCEGLSITGMDNLMRAGSEINRSRLRRLGIEFVHGDIRLASDFDALPPDANWVIDAAASSSVLAGVRGQLNSRQLFEHNLASIVNVLEYCKRYNAGMVLLSSSRVYSIAKLRSLPLKTEGNAFQLDDTAALPAGVSKNGICVDFSTSTPVSLYGCTKLASEMIALEYCSAFGFPVWVDRCGVLAGAGQFGTIDQGIFSYWINAHLRRRPLRYIGFEGSGKQVRDVFHPNDLAALMCAQMRCSTAGGRRVYNVGGGLENSMSLAQLTAWCNARFGPHQPLADAHERPYDVPWLIMDSHDAQQDFGWGVEVRIERLLEEIARHAEQSPDWLEMSNK